MNLLEHEVYDLLSKHGIAHPKYRFVSKNDEPRLDEGKLFVAKISGRDILHKSDGGGLIFGVTSKNSFSSHRELVSKFDEAEGVLYVETVEYGHTPELIIGAYVDEFFGPLVTVGFGGTGTDYLNDVMRPGKAKAVFPASASKETVKKVLLELPVVKMVTGNIRGYKKLIESDKLIETVVKLQGLITEEYNGNVIEEVEVNPAVCYGGKLLALDGVLRFKEKRPKRAPKPIQKIGSLLNPSSACIVGASGKNPYNPANVILKNLLSAGLEAKEICLIHPKEESIEGIKCTPDLKTMLSQRGGRPVDLMVVGIPAKSAAALITESFELNAANTIQVISAGFGETKGGKELQKDLEDKLHALESTPDKRPVMNGPNTLGNIYLNKKTLFTVPRKSSGTGKGHTQAALICQSGAFMITAISNLANIIAPTASISVGNQMDITVGDCLEYLLDDPKIKTYGLYIEGLKEGDGRKLMELSKKAKETGKFVVIYKAGRTKDGVDAAKGHTASMAGDYSLFEGLLAMNGALIADTFQEFQNLLMLTALVKPIKKIKEFGVAALSNAGYEKCAIADHLMITGAKKFTLANYSDDTKDKIKAIYEAHKVSGIMDVHDILDLTPMMDDAGFEEMIRATLSDPKTGFGIYSIVPETLMLKVCEEGSNKEETDEGILARLIKIHAESEKPFCVSMESGWKYDNFAQKCLDAGIPCFRRVDAAARCVAKLCSVAIS
ncbi:MAG: hypothetical protein COV46_07730 [Deltaproteobacteria bacterium CG11_big_fil_rev_8_21_14_0_20_49_13]|nr:MAG: hypothetical protein COV46_07730 [Deltaproteobacteria bacterium CG11_big_fil_rev_8_21_14_0_20_49_13]